MKTYKYDFEKCNIEVFSKKVQEIDGSIQKAEDTDISPLCRFVKLAKEKGMPICFFGAGGAASPATYATQLANADGLVATTLTPMSVMDLSADVVKKMLFLAITSSGKPSDMVSATEYLIKIAPENVFCLTTSSLTLKDRYGRLANKVGLLIAEKHPENALCLNLSIHQDGFVGTNKHVGLSLLLYRAFHPEETGFVDKLILEDEEPFEVRMPEGTNLGNITDLHILYGALGKAAANDMEGRMIETGVMPAMPTDFKNYTHGRHVFSNTHRQSAILMLISPADEKFVKGMLKLIPDDIPMIFIRTKRTDMLGALQLMIRTFYLSINICYPRNINAFRPGAPEWGGKLWSLKIQK